VGPRATTDVKAKRKLSAVVRIETLFVKPVVSFFHELPKKNTNVFLALW
jgi:hypothetical protein